MHFVLRLIALLLLSVAVRAESPLKSKASVVALVFISSDCPISNKLGPEIERIHSSFKTNDLLLCVVYPNKSDTEEVIAKHRRDFRLTSSYFRDSAHELMKKAGVTVTPEAAVFDADRNLVYRGRVTDQFLALGRSRPEPLTHDLAEAIAATLAGRPPKEARTQAVGCFIEEP